jgi:protein ImuA
MTTGPAALFNTIAAAPLLPDQFLDAFPANDPPAPAKRAAHDFSGEAAAQYLWRGTHALGAQAAVLSSGFAALDATLPGGGWPLNSLNEWLTPGPGHGEWMLLAPLLGTLSKRAQPVLLINPPHMPYAPGLVQAGVDLRQVLIVNAHHIKNADLWTTEQALRAGCLGAVVVFSHSNDSKSLRRIKLACESHAGLCIMVRDSQYAGLASPASVRVHLRAQRAGVQLEFLKLRGKAVHQALILSRAHSSAATPKLAACAQSSAQSSARLNSAAG